MDTRSALKDARERHTLCWNDGEHDALPGIEAEIANLQESREQELASLDRLGEQVAHALSKANLIEADFAGLCGRDDDRSERLTMALAEAHELIKELQRDTAGERRQ